LVLVAPATHAELESSARELIDGDRGLRYLNWLAPSEVGDEGPDASASGCLRDRGQPRPPIEDRLFGLPEVKEVVGDEDEVDPRASSRVPSVGQLMVPSFVLLIR